MKMHIAKNFDVIVSYSCLAEKWYWFFIIRIAMMCGIIFMGESMVLKA